MLKWLEFKKEAFFEGKNDNDCYSLICILRLFLSGSGPLSRYCQ